MISRLLRILGLTLSLLSGPALSVEQAIPDLHARITDITQTLSAAKKAQLEERLAAFESRKGSQLAVLIIPTTSPEPIEAYALRVVEKWKIGRQKVDDGALVLVALNDRAVRIEVGYGLEGVLPDAVCKRIIDQTIVPRFRERDYAGGIEAGLNQMMGVIEGEPLPPPAPAPPTLSEFIPQFVVMAVILGLFLRVFWGLWPASLLAGLFMSLLTWWMLGTVFMALLAGAMAIVINLGMGLGILPSPGNHRDRGGRGGGFGGGGGGFGGGGASGRW